MNRTSISINAIKERPIIFSDVMVSAILSGRKTQTRRLVHARKPNCPYGRIGERLWVKEAFAFLKEKPYSRGRPENYEIFYRADVEESNPVEKTWKSSLYMPRRASRINLKITNVRKEQLQDINEDDARAEGAEFFRYPKVRRWSHDGTYQYDTARESFRALWEKIHSSELRLWASNPQVWVIEFEQI